jgi:competence protein ComEA
VFGLERRNQIIIFIILGALLFGGGIKYARQVITDDSGAVVIEADPNKAVITNDHEEATIYVHVVGAVQNPGIFQLSSKARVFEVIEKAVPLPEAELQLLNLAKILHDEQTIYVPKVGEVAQSTPIMANETTGPDSLTIKKIENSLTAQESSPKVNINNASVTELSARLPGVGPALAQRIVEYRQQKGNFRSVEDIQNVSGIGEKRYAQMKEIITVNP